MTAEDKAAHKVSRPALPPHPPAITVLPAYPTNINRRALAQSKRCIAAQSKVQQTNDIVRIDVQDLENVTGDVSVLPAQALLQSPFTPEGQDFDAAGILLAVAHQPSTISTTGELGDTLAATVDELEEDAVFKPSWTCPVSTCIDHRKGFLSKLERDKHTRAHFEGMGCGHFDCHASDFIYNESKHMSAHTQLFHPASVYDTHKRFKCQSCTQEFEHNDYLDHFDDCMIRTVERKALGNAAPCPVSTCDHHLIDFGSTYLRGQHLLQYHLTAPTCIKALTGCKQCSKAFGLDKFKCHVLENHENGPLNCNYCDMWLCRERFIEHFDRCHEFLTDLRRIYSEGFY